MKAKKNLLITCAGGSAPIFLARNLRRKFNIFLADATGQNMAANLGFPFKVIPLGNNPRYDKVIGQLIKKWKINIVVPGAEEELVSIGRISQKYGRLITVMPNNPKFVKLCLDKSALMAVLGQLKISGLATYKQLAEVKYPAIVKPNSGRGSRGVHIVNNAKEFEGYLDLYHKKFPQVLTQEYIGGTEYTISVIVNNLNKLIGIVPKKVILKRGITRAAVSRASPIISKVCKKIVEALRPCGPFNVQLKVFRNQVYIFEINPRLSTTAVLTDKAFGNEVELFIKYYNKNEIKGAPAFKKNVFLFRYEENYFKFG